METIIITIITTLGGVFSASGLWTYLSNRSSKFRDGKYMLIGIGHNLICELCEKYIIRGYITEAEYEDLVDYLYKPYKALGGNGTAERLISEVNKLPMLSADMAKAKQIQKQCDNCKNK